jgi:hypothetical protein
MKRELDSLERDQAAYRAALRLSAISKSEKERELFEAAADELADIIGLSQAMPILEEELDFLRAERRKLQAEVVRLEEDVPQGDSQSIYAKFQTAMVKAGFEKEISYLDEAFREFLEMNEIEVRV